MPTGARAPLPLCILLTPGMGGPHAWAVRLRERISLEREVLIGCLGRSDDLRPDFTFETDEELCDRLVRLGSAIVMPNWLWSTYGICSQARAAGARLSVVAYCRSDKSETYYEPLRGCVVHWDWLVAVSAEIHDELARQGYDSRRLRLMHTFVDRPDILKRDWQTKPLRMLYSGRLERLDKNVLCLPEVLAELSRRGLDVTLTVAGSGSSGTDLRRAFHAARVQGNVRFTGQLPPAAMAPLYLKHDALIMTSTIEGRSNALLEAMAHGCVPVIFRTPTGWGEVLPPALHHLAVPQGDISAMADALARLVQTPGYMAATARQAHAATADSSWEAYRARFGVLLDEVEASM